MDSDAGGEIDPTTQFDSGLSTDMATATAIVFYQSDTGKLLFDTNGSTDGGWLQFATLTGRPQDLDASDFMVV